MLGDRALKITLFLGAGASMSFGKPTTSKLRKILLAKSYADTFHNFILRSLLQVEKFTDIEYVLQAIKDIVDFSDSVGNDYFSSLGYQATFRHTMLVHGSNSYTFDQVIAELKKVYDTLKREIFENYSWKHMDEEDKNLTSIYDRIIPLLGKFSDEIHIFTTNYDQAIEIYCDKNSNLQCVDGFVHDVGIRKNIWAKGDYDYLGKKEGITNVYLYKLHGSLNWKKHIQYNFVRTDEESIPSDPKFTDNMLIYPALSPKDDGKNNEPYKTILAKFDNYMNNAQVCIVIGFSFRDEHINEVFERFYESGKVLIVFSPHAVRDFRKNILHETPSEQELAEWEKLSSMNIKDKVFLIQKKIEVGTVDDIVREITPKLS